MKRRQHTDRFKRKIVNLKLTGVTATELSDKYGVRTNLINKWSRDPRFISAKAPGRPGRPNGMSDADLDKRRSRALVDIRKGMTVADTAMKNGIHATTVRMWVREDKTARSENPAHKLAEALLDSVRPLLVTGISELVDLAVRQRMDVVVSTLTGKMS